LASSFGTSVGRLGTCLLLYSLSPFTEIVFCIDILNILVPVPRKSKRFRIKTPSSALTLLSVTSIGALLTATTVCHDLFGT